VALGGYSTRRKKKLSAARRCATIPEEATRRERATCPVRSLVLPGEPTVYKLLLSLAALVPGYLGGMLIYAVGLRLFDDLRGWDGLAVAFGAYTVGGPLGALVGLVVGFWAGMRLDEQRQARRLAKLLEQAEAEAGPARPGPTPGADGADPAQPPPPEPPAG
jgi:hypothetical protein